MKVAVVGGGSTYTPELVSGLCASRPVESRAGAARHRRRAARGGRRARRRMLARGLRGTLTSPASSTARVEGADVVLIQIRVGGQAARLLDETLPLPCGCIGQETTGAGGFAKAMRTVPVVLEIAERVARAGRARRLDRRLHQPGRDRHARAARRRPSRGRAVQRGDRLPARDARACSASTPSRLRGRPGRPQPPHLGARRAARRRRRAAASCSPSTASELRRAVGAAARSCSTELGAVPVLLPALLLRARRGARRAAAGATPRAQAVAEIERELLELYRDPALDEQAGAARAARRRLLQRGGDARWSRSLAAGDGRRPGGRRPQRRHARRASRRTTSSRCRRAIGATAPQPLAAGAARAGAARPRPARRRLRAARGRGGRDARPGASRARRCSPTRWSASGSVGRAARRAAAEAASPSAGRRDERASCSPSTAATRRPTSRSSAPTARCSALVRGPRSSPHHIGLDGCARRARRPAGRGEASAGLAGRRRRWPTSPGSCWPGADLPQEEAPLHAAVAARGWAARTAVGNDTFAVLRAGTERGWGVAVVCGAGINCVGVAPDGRDARFPALGRDHRRLGRRLRRRPGGAGGGRARSDDGRGPRTALRAGGPGRFGLETPRSLAEAIHPARSRLRAPARARPGGARRGRGRDDVAAGHRRPAGRRGGRVRARGDRRASSLARRAGRGPARRRADARRPAADLRRRSTPATVRRGPADRRARRARSRRSSAPRCSGSTTPVGRRAPSGCSAARLRRTSGGDDRERRAMAEVRYERATRALSGDRRAGGRRARRSTIADGELMVLVGPSGLGQVDGAADAGRAGGGRRRDDLDRRPRRDRRSRPRSATSRWCSRTTRCTRTSTSRRTSPSRCRWRGVQKAERARRVREVAELLDLVPYLERKPGAALGRPAPAGGHGAGDRARAGGVPDGRAAVQPRRASCACRCAPRSPRCRRGSA